MSDKPLFQNADEQERIYAPDQVPEERDRIVADERDQPVDPAVLPEAAPVASAGNAPSANAAPPNLGHTQRNTLPGDPETQGEYPLDDRER